MFANANLAVADTVDSPLDEYLVSLRLRKFSEAFCRRFPKGIGVNQVDVAVIAAFEMRIGFSDRELWGAGQELPPATIDKLAHRLLHRFWGSLRESYPTVRSEDIANLIRFAADA